MSTALEPATFPYAPADAAPRSFAERARAAAELLEAIVADRALLAELDDDARKRLLQAAGQVSRPDALDRRRLVKETRRQRKAEKVDRAEEVLASTGIRALRREALATAHRLFPPVAPEALLAAETSPEPPRENGETHNCYVCKRDYTELHHFYDQLCPACAALNFRKRTETAELGGRVALVTGGRVKIGFQASLKLLRAGAAVIVTTRFPRDSALRYAKEPDFAAWSDRLQIFGLDLRHTPSVEAFCQELLATRTRLDFIVNNACQTVRRPPAFYQHMLAAEEAALHTLPAPVRAVLGAYEGLRAERILADPSAPEVRHERAARVAELGTGALAGAGLDEPALARHGLDRAGLLHAARLSQVRLLADETDAQGALFPEGRYDEDQQQVDLRDRNSWRLQLDEVPSVELLEVQLVNAVAPFVLNARLKALMTRTPERDKHVVNVSAMEGQFYRRFKTTRHPHTNMAKAALNMMTRTSAADYFHDGIHMNAVDTGWVTDEDPIEIAARKTAEHRFHPPLDIVDGAARIVDPIIDGFNTGRHVWGLFLKDYAPTDW